MTRFLIRRIIGGVLTLWVVSIVTFLIFFIVPKALGSNPAILFAGRSPDPSTVKAVEVKLGLDKPILTQYDDYLAGIFVGRHYDNGPDKTYCPAPCLGYSFKNNQAVWSELTGDLPVDLSLAVGAGAIWLVTGVAVGILSALRKGSIIDRASMAVALAGVALPVYFTGLILLYLFSYTWNILPNVQFVGFTQNPLSWARNLILPWVTLAFLFAALYARLTRAGMLETLGEDYVRTARAKGLPERRVVGKHALRAALTPIITIFGLDIGTLIGTAVLTEKTFGFRGISFDAIEAINNQDLPVIVGVTLFAAFFVVVANIIVDILYAVLDPRVRLS